MAIATPTIDRALDDDFAAAASREALERAQASLSAHGFETVIVSDGPTARDFVLPQIPRGSEVHWGAGATATGIGLADALETSSDVVALGPGCRRWTGRPSTTRCASSAPPRTSS